MAEVTHTPDGKFAVANKWRWTPGNKGRTPRYATAKAVNNAIVRYLSTLEPNHGPAWSGLACALGVSRSTLTRLYKGEGYQHIAQLDAIRDVLEQFRSYCEAWREERLSDKDSSTRGHIYWLNNRSSDAWKTESHVNQGDTGGQATVIIQMPESYIRMAGLEDRPGITVDNTPESEPKPLQAPISEGST